MIPFASVPFLALLLASPHNSLPAWKAPSKVVVGYIQDPSDNPCEPGSIDFRDVTHLNVAFANPTDTAGNLSVPPNLAAIVDLAHQSNVKVSISIGGGFASTDATARGRYLSLISPANRAGFVGSLLEYVDRYRLDGLDVDLEGPAVNQDYAAFVGALSGGLKAKGKLLSAALSSWFGGDQVTKDALDSLDLVNVMAYDATGPWNPTKPGQHSSLEFAKTSVAYWLGRGVPKSKLVLGIPFYGWGFGDSFNQGGYTFAQIVDKYPGSEMSDQAGNKIWYNGIPTIRAKAKYVVDQGLAGVMIWSIDQDAKGDRSLLAAIRNELKTK